MVAVEIDAALVEEARKLDRSPNLNRSNILFSRLSMKIARQLLSSSSPSPPHLNDLERKLVELATLFNSNGAADADAASDRKPPFCCVEGVAYAINALKMRSITGGPGHVAVTVPFYCEFERGRPFAPETNPNGEESPIQKLEEALFLLDYNDKISMDLIFVNDAIAEKKDDQDGGSARLFKRAILAYATKQGIKINLQKPAAAAAADDDQDFDCLTALEGRLNVRFTSCEIEASQGGSQHETATEKRRRLENRDPRTGKLRERKGGAVLAGMELDLPQCLADHRPHRALRCLVDGDSAHPVASFVGDAAHSILERGHAAYLGNLRHPCTCVSTAVTEEGGGAVSAGTQARVQNRKLFFSGFVVPFLFPELALKYHYTGTTQLPIKAFRGDIDFRKAKLKTVQPNVDLGMLALLCSYLNNNSNVARGGGGGSIDSGPVTIRDNVASSTMTTGDLSSEWTKTYGPIFTSAVSLCRELKPNEFERLPVWLTTFIENMELKHYTTLFGEEAASDPDVVALFSTMRKFQGAAADDADRAAVLDELKTSFDKIFAV